MTTYATAEDYATFKGLTYPGDWDEAEVARINAALLLAQSDVDDVIRFARYDLTDEAIATALKKATCARFDYMEATGDEGDGAADQFESAGIGSVRLTRRSAANQLTLDQATLALGTRAAKFLRAAGLISSVVYQS